MKRADVCVCLLCVAGTVAVRSQGLAAPKGHVVPTAPGKVMSGESYDLNRRFWAWAAVQMLLIREPEYHRASREPSFLCYHQ